MWVKHSFVWTARFPWLIALEEDGKVKSLGCSVCCKAPEGQRDQNGFAQCSITSAQTSVFQKHEGSLAHAARCESLKSSGGSFPVVAPTAQQFAELVEAVWKGAAEIKSAGPWKCRAMTWCLAEAWPFNPCNFKCVV